MPVFFTFIEEASNNFLEKVHPLHKGGRKAAEEIVLAPSLEPGIVEGAGVKFSIY